MKRFILTLVFALVYGLAEARTFWVSPTGNDGNTCTDTTSPISGAGTRLTVRGGMGCGSGLQPGDTLYVRAGTYTAPTELGFSAFPSGTGWGTSQVITIASAPGETATLTNETLRADQATTQYISFERFIIDATGSPHTEAIYVSSAPNIRFRQNEIRNAPQNCVQADTSNLWLDGNTIHTCGSDNANLAPGSVAQYHAVYTSGAGHRYEKNTIHTVTSAPGTLNRGYCFQFYPSPSNFTVQGNVLHTCGPLTLYGSGHQVSGNIAYNSGGTADFSVDNATSSSIVNNTLVSAVPVGIYNGGVASNTIRNNIVVNHTTADIYQPAGTVSHNYCTSGCTGTGTINSSANPFVNAAANNYALVAGSSAINAGAAIRLYNGTAPDIGAHETIGLSSCVADGNSLTLQFENNLNPPMLFPSVTGSTLIVDGTLRTLSLPTVVNNQVTMTFSGAVFQSSALYSYAVSGAASDSALIGGSNNQRLNAIANFSCAGVAPPALVAWYKFEELAGSTPQDSSGNGLHGSFDGNVAYTASGRVGRGLSFPADGTGTMTVPDNNLLDLDNLSIMAWVRPNALSTVFRTVLAKNYVYFLYSAIGDAYCGTGFPIGGATNGISTDIACHASALPAATWTHLALTRSSSTLTLYRDGVSVATAPVTVPAGTSSGTLQIGGSQYGERFEGILDEVKIYSGVRTQAEIVQDMASASTLATFKFGDKTVKLGDKTIKIGN